MFVYALGALYKLTINLKRNGVTLVNGVGHVGGVPWCTRWHTTAPPGKSVAYELVVSDEHTDNSLEG